MCILKEWVRFRQLWCPSIFMWFELTMRMRSLDVSVFLGESSGPRYSTTDSGDVIALMKWWQQWWQIVLDNNISCISMWNYMGSFVEKINWGGCHLRPPNLKDVPLPDPGVGKLPNIVMYIQHVNTRLMVGITKVQRINHTWQSDRCRPVTLWGQPTAICLVIAVHFVSNKHAKPGIYKSITMLRFLRFGFLPQIPSKKSFMNKRVTAIHGPKSTKCIRDLESSDDDFLENTASAMKRDIRNKYTTFPRDLGAEEASVFLKPHYGRLQGLRHTNNKLHQVSKLPYISWSVCALRVYRKYTIIWVNLALVAFTLTYSNTLPCKGYRSRVPTQTVTPG